VLVRHELTHRCRCPVNDARDTYAVIVEANRIMKVEDILAAVAALPDRLFQEQITEILAASLACSVTTTGYHSGVKTTCVC
jgi:hypothetical protein